MDNSWLFALMGNPVFIKIVQLTVILLMFTIALRLPLTLKQPLFEPALLIRTLLSVNILVPVALFLLLLILKPLQIPLPFQIALIVLAASPGAPLLTTRALKAGGHFHYAADLQVAVSLLATITTPVILILFSFLNPEIPKDAVSPLHVLKIVAIVQLIPILLGMGIRAINAAFADKLVKWIAVFVKIMFLGLILILLITGFPTLFSGGFAGIIAVLLFSAACLAIGHLLGGPVLQYKSTLAIGCLARNIGLALLILKLNKAVMELLPPVIAFLLIGAVMGLVYSAFMKKKIAKEEKTASGEQSAEKQE